MLSLEQLIKTGNVIFVIDYGVRLQKERSGVNFQNVQVGSFGLLVILKYW